MNVAWAKHEFSAQYAGAQVVSESSMAVEEEPFVAVFGVLAVGLQKISVVLLIDVCLRFRTIELCGGISLS